MMNKNYKKIAVVIAIMILTLSVASTGFAANTVASLKAYYKNITVYKNGTQVQFSSEPFIVDGTTYVPLRDISQVLDKDVTWDGVNYKIGINDKAGQNVSSLMSQILTQQQRITQLEAQIKTLQTNKTVDLDDLEDDLNDDYDEIGDVTVVEIKLDGDEDDIEVEIYVDLTKTAEYDAWEDLDDDDIEDFLQDIVDDILKEYKDADITGFIEDEDDGSKLVKFTISSKDKVVLGGSSSGSMSDFDIDDLEDYLNDEYEKVNGVYFSFYLDGDEDDLDVEIVADVEDITDDFDEDELEDFLNDVYDDIVATDEFEGAYISGFVEDDLGEIDFSFNSKGVLDLRW